MLITCRKLFLACFVLLALVKSTAYAKVVLDKPVRKLDVVMSFYIDIKGNKSTVFDLTSLIPQSVKGKQDISSVIFSPSPYSTYNLNGNKYAKWRFKGKSIKRVIEVHFKTVLYQQDLNDKKSSEKLLQKDKIRLVKREKYLDVGSRIIKKAQNEIAKKNNEIEQVGEILKFVNASLNPSKASTKMLGASKALKRGTGDCTEFTDVFVTLARQMGLPARHMSGYILTKSTSLGHSWAEVYTKEKGWITVDPLHVLLKLGTFEKLENKYLIFSGIRNDSELGRGMLYSWDVKRGLGARVKVKVQASEKR